MKNQLEIAQNYVPTTEKNKSGYVKTVWEQVLGRDRNGQQRPFEDLIYFLQVCKDTGLNPTTRQIYGVYRWDSRFGREKMTIQTSIDGLRTIAERTGLYAGSDDAKFEYQGESELPTLATVTVYKLNLKTGERMPTTASARWSEYYPGDKQGGMWKKMPHVMLGKCAEALALRKAFPVAGQVYTDEEMSQADTITLPEPKKTVADITADSQNIKDKLLQGNK